MIRSRPVIGAIGNGLTRLQGGMRDAHLRHMLSLPFTLPFTLRRFFRDRLDPAAAPAVLKEALRTREQRFLDLTRTRIYAEPDSPYAKLFQYAGCTVDDLDASLSRDGLDATLAKLARAGVYLTPNEFKGKTDVHRGSLRFRLRAERLAPRHEREAPASFVTQSSGSNNRPVRAVTSLAWQVAESPAMAVFLAAHGLLSHRHAVYEPMLAGVAAGIQAAIMVARLGIPIERWFARPVPVQNWLEGAYFWATAQELALAGTWFGPGFARPEVVPADGLERIVRWVEHCRHENQPACIRTVASNAARIARTAIAIGASLAGCTFIASGEPMTTAKRRAITEAGAAVAVAWGYEPGPVWVGFGCANPAHGDEMHILRHTLAVIQQPIAEAVDEESQPLLFTTLYPSAARLQINVSNGDRATLFERDCGCALQRVGLNLHVHGVGSFEKLTSEGLAYSYDALFELLETTLPDAFGGGAGDYQIVEEESASGQTFLTLLVDPTVGPVDDARLLARLAAELCKGSPRNRFMTSVWQDAGTLRVRRAPPIVSARGKVLPLRVARQERTA